MGKQINLTALASLIDDMVAALARRSEMLPPHAMAGGDWHRKLHNADQKLRADIDKLGGWFSRPSGDGIAVTLGGLRASSTSGVAGACRNWLTAAKKKLETPGT